MSVITFSLSTPAPCNHDLFTCRRESRLGPCNTHDKLDTITQQFSKNAYNWILLFTHTVMTWYDCCCVIWEIDMLISENRHCTRDKWIWLSQWPYFAGVTRHVLLPLLFFSIFHVNTLSYTVFINWTCVFILLIKLSVVIYWVAWNDKGKCWSHTSFLILEKDHFHMRINTFYI